MIETKMPKDIRVYKTKLIGPFSARQILCIAAIVAVDILLYVLVVAPIGLPLEFVFYGFLFIDIPIAAFGWIEPQGMTLEKYLILILLRSFLAPTKRKPVAMIYKADSKEDTAKKKKKKEKRADRPDTGRNP